MRLLKKIAWIIALIVFLALLKFVLNRTSSGSAIFHVNLLTGLQWFLFLGLVCWLILRFIWKVARRKDFSFWLSWLFFLLLMALGEWEMYYLMRKAGTVSGNTHGYLLRYYLLYERELPEVRSHCAQYDPELTYTYKPGAVCQQQAPEFVNSIYINRAGLRDDDASLVRPQIICLGDSYTMGSGVQQQETYSQVLEGRTGLKVLNAGISSYGTAREMMLLKRLDTSALQYLIIQYCFNDIDENKSYVQHGNKLPIRSQQDYEQLVNNHKWATRYFPLKRVLTLSRMIVKDQLQILLTGKSSVRGRNYDTSYVPDASRTFLDIVYGSGINFSKVKVLVIDMNRYPIFDHQLIEKAAQMVQAGNYSDDFKKSIRFVDVTKLNDRALYYPLDNHLNKDGHSLLAELIYSALSGGSHSH